MPPSRSRSSSWPGSRTWKGRPSRTWTARTTTTARARSRRCCSDPAKAPLVKHLADDKGTGPFATTSGSATSARSGRCWPGRSRMGFTRLRRQAPLRPGVAVRPRPRRPLREPGAAHQDRVGRQEPVQGLPPAEFRRRGRAVLHEDDRGSSRGPGEPEDRLPELRRQGYELAGFVWYHGWNDGVDPKNAVPEYEQNLVNLIQRRAQGLQGSRSCRSSSAS